MATATTTDRRQTAQGRARRMLSAIVPVDVVGGLACVLLAGPIRDAFGLDGAAPVVVLGIAQLALAATGWAASRARPDRLAAALRRQAALNAACAALLAAVAAAGASAAGTAVLAAAAAAVAALAVAQAAMAARCG